MNTASQLEKTGVMEVPVEHGFAQRTFAEEPEGTEERWMAYWQIDVVEIHQIETCELRAEVEEGEGDLV